MLSGNSYKCRVVRIIPDMVLHLKLVVGKTATICLSHFHRNFAHLPVHYTHAGELAHLLGDITVLDMVPSSSVAYDPANLQSLLNTLHDYVVDCVVRMEAVINVCTTASSDDNFSRSTSIRALYGDANY